MIIDCFTFFNELDMLECRLDYLNSTVNYFVLVESNITFSGKQKPLYFVENQRRFEKYKSKIIYYPLVFDNSIHNFNFDFDENQLYADYKSAQWQVEYMQRNHIANALKMFDGNPHVILSDVDEIPSIEAIDFAKNNLIAENPVAALIVKLFFYNLSIMDSQQWPAIVFTIKDFLLEKTPQFLRTNHRNFSIMPQISNAGWHLSYFGSPEQIQYKIDSYSHQENNRIENTNIENIKNSIENGIGLFTHNKNEKYISVEKDFFPKDFFESFQRFYPS